MTFVGMILLIAAFLLYCLLIYGLVRFVLLLTRLPIRDAEKLAERFMVSNFPMVIIFCLFFELYTFARHAFSRLMKAFA